MFFALYLSVACEKFVDFFVFRNALILSIRAAFPLRPLFGEYYTRFFPVRPDSIIFQCKGGTSASTRLMETSASTENWQFAISDSQFFPFSFHQLV